MASTLAQFKRLNLSVMRKVFSLMGPREKIVFLVLLFLLAADLLFFASQGYRAITKPLPTYGSEYREGILGQPRLINPALASTPVDEALVNLVYAGLYTYNEDGQLIPNLAESMPQISDDQKQYTITLRKDAVWHDGKPVTAADVLFTVKLIQNPVYQSPLHNLWLSTQIEKNGDYMVIFANKDISSPFMHNLTLPILPEHIWQYVTPENFALSSLNLEAVGSGPFVLKEIKKLPNGQVEHIKFESFSNYHGGKPYITDFTAIFFETYEELIGAMHAKITDGFGYISLDVTLALDLERNNLQALVATLPQYQAMFFNLKNSVLADKAVRTALNFATDRKAIVTHIYSFAGRNLEGPLLPEQLRQQASLNATPADIITAISILDQAGWKMDASGVRVKGQTPLAFTITTNDLPANSKAAELMAEQWKQVGANVNITVLPTQDLAEQALRPRAFDALLFAVKLPSDPDPFQLWHSSQAKDPGLNITQFNNAEVDKLISEARSIIDFTARIPKYERVQAIILEEHPAIFLDQTTFVYVVNKEVKGMTMHSLPDPAHRFSHASRWYVEEKRVWK